MSHGLSKQHVAVNNGKHTWYPSRVDGMPAKATLPVYSSHIVMPKAYLCEPMKGMSELTILSAVRVVVRERPSRTDR